MHVQRAEPGHRSSRLRGPLPVHMQISEMLIREIASGRLADGERLPPEREMAASLGIAVGTLRRALRDLTENGLAGAHPGFRQLCEGAARDAGRLCLLPHRASRGRRAADGRHPCRRRGGKAGRTAAVRHRRHAATASAGCAGWAARRPRIEEIWLDGTRADRLAAEVLSESLYLHYRNALGFHIARADDRVGLGTVPDWAPAAFPLRPGAVAGFIERIAWANDGASAEFSRTWFDPATARYVARLR